MSFFTDILGNTIGKFFIGVLLFIDSIIYSLVSWVYQIILVLCNVNILNNGEEISNLVGRVYVILGVVVLFLVSYSLLRSLVNPDEALKGKKSPITILRDVVISIVLIAFVPMVFRFLQGFQTAILSNNVIGNLVLGTSSSVNGQTESSGDLVNKGGMEIASGVFQAFLHEDYAKCTLNSNEAGYDCSSLRLSNGDNFNVYWAKMKDSGSLLSVVDLTDDITGGNLTYYYLISTIAGAFVLFVMISYCFDIALRVIKLAFCELIAPLPILARLMPNESTGKIFSNWLKATISIYVEVFIRLATLFFAVLIIKIIKDNFLTLLAPLFSGGVGFTVALFAQMFIILGVIMFVKQLPGIIKEITGLDSGKYNFMASAMRGFNAIRTVPKVAVQSFNNTNWDDAHKVRSVFNRFKNSVVDVGSSLIANQGADYKEIGSISKNYERFTTESLSTRRRKEAIRKARQNRKDMYANGMASRADDRKAAFQEYLHGSVDTKAIEERIKLAKSVGADIKDQILSQAIETNINVRNLDNAFKNLQARVPEVSDYYTRVTAENLDAINNALRAAGSSVQLNANDIGNYFDATTGASYTYDVAREEARKKHDAAVGELKSKRDKFAMATAWGAATGNWTVQINGENVFDTTSNGDFHNGAGNKRLYTTQVFENLQKEWNSSIDMAVAKSSDVAGSPVVSEHIDIASYANADELKKKIGARKDFTDEKLSEYNAQLAAARSREQLKAETKGDGK